MKKMKIQEKKTKTHFIVKMVESGQKTVMPFYLMGSSNGCKRQGPNSIEIAYHGVYSVIFIL